MSTQNKKIGVFLDNIGRIIMGNVVGQDKETTSIENPALVHIQPHPQTNQLQLQLLPLFFKEFQADRSKPTVWKFRNNIITVAEPIELSDQFLAQYQQTFAGGAPQMTNEENPVEVVKLFDDEEKKD